MTYAVCTRQQGGYSNTSGKKRYDRNMHMRWKRKEVPITSQCEGATFSLTGEDNVYCIEGVDNFKYPGRIIDQLDYDWPAFLWNSGKARRVWNRQGKLL